MAPLPQEDNNPSPTEDNPSPAPPPSATSPPEPQYWTKANIATTSIFALLTFIIVLLLLAFFLRKRSENKKKKRHHRKSDQVGLLQNEDKTSMFSRERHSSVTLYLDHDDHATAGVGTGKRGSQNALSLTPLQITPLEDVHDPMSTVRNGGNGNGIGNNKSTASNGSSVCSTSRFSTQTASTMMLSPFMPNEDGDLGTRPSGRPRSTSTASMKARYYDTTPMNVEMPPVPKIIRTPSD